MLTLLLGKDWVANRNEILRRISGDIRAGLGGRIYMVPELISHDTERRLAAAAGHTASRYAEVLSFTRLARRVTEEMHIIPMECLDNGGRVVAMAAAARQLHSKLKAYASVETRPEFLQELVDGIDEFKRCCITSADLLAASAQTEGSLAQKLEELSLLLESYDALCSQGRRDPRDQMTWLLEQLEDGDFGRNHVFYIDGFPDFTRQHLDIIAHLIGTSSQVTVSLNCSCVQDKRMAFEKAGHTALQLLQAAKEQGIPYEIITVAEEPSHLTSVREGLFQGKLHKLPELNGKLSLYRVDTVYNECMAAAQEIRTLVQNGCRYRDISVVCTDMAAYRDTLSWVFHRCNIPLYESGKEDILQKSVIATVLSALDAALGGFEQRDVLRYLKSVLSPLDVDTCDLVENYAIVWGIRGSKWQNPWENHPGGLGKDWTDADREALRQLEAARAMAITPLFHLAQGFRRATKLSQQIEALYAFLEEIHLAEKLGDLARELDSRGDNRSAQILNQLWEILLSAMEQLYDVLGETAWEQDVFCRLFILLLSQYDVGTIPPVLDAVMAGPANAMRCQEVKHLIVLGALEGTFPGYAGAKGVLTDQERVALRQLGVPLTGGNLEGLQAEFADIYGVFCGARESIRVFCPAGESSYIYRRLCDMTEGEKDYPINPALTVANTTDAAAFLAAGAFREEAKRLQIHEEYDRICHQKAYSLGSVSSGNIQKLYGKKLRLSASQVDKQAQCRFSYFLRYGLRAQERKEATIDPAEFGTYVHAVLEQTGREVMRRGGFHTISLEDTWNIAKGYSDAYVQERFSQIDSKRVEYLLCRNVLELEMIVKELWQELHVSRFTPIAFELDFGDGKTMPAISIGGKEMQATLRGFVDRVDTWQAQGRNFFRVVDYKTGKKDFDYCDIFNGIGLQMILYLFALEQNGSFVLGDAPIGAGVQYFSARSPILSSEGRISAEAADIERGKQWNRQGLVLAEEAILDAMEPEGSPKRIDYSQKSDGTLTGDLASRTQFRQLKRYVTKLLGDMVDEIAAGNVEPNPYTRGNMHSACTYCPYSSVCHADTVAGRRNYASMNAQRFWEEIGKELHNG